MTYCIDRNDLKPNIFFYKAVLAEFDFKYVKKNSGRYLTRFFSRRRSAFGKPYLTHDRHIIVLYISTEKPMCKLETKKILVPEHWKKIDKFILDHI